MATSNCNPISLECIHKADCIFSPFICLEAGRRWLLIFAQNSKGITWNKVAVYYSTQGSKYTTEHPKILIIKKCLDH